MKRTPSLPPQPEDVDAVQQLNALPQSEVRARFRSLLPLIDELVLQGVPYGAIAAALEKSGITMKAASIRQARCRYRKQESITVTHTAPTARNESSAMPASTPAPQRPQPIGAITTKADLVQLRRSADTIDLNQLAEIGRQK